MASCCVRDTFLLSKDAQKRPWTVCSLAHFSADANFASVSESIDSWEAKSACRIVCRTSCCCGFTIGFCFMVIGLDDVFFDFLDDELCVAFCYHGS